MSTSSDLSSHKSFLVIDGPNVDAVLGHSILGRCPCSGERPRWDRLHSECCKLFGPLDARFYLNGNKFDFKRCPFYRFLRQSGYRVDTPRNEEVSDPVDAAIINFVTDLPNESHVILLSHDGGYSRCLEELLRRGVSVTIVGFIEWMKNSLTSLKPLGACYLDLQRDLCCFDVTLPMRPFVAV